MKLHPIGPGLEKLGIHTLMLTVLGAAVLSLSIASEARAQIPECDFEKTDSCTFYVGAARGWKVERVVYHDGFSCIVSRTREQSDVNVRMKLSAGMDDDESTAARRLEFMLLTHSMSLIANRAANIFLNGQSTPVNLTKTPENEIQFFILFNNRRAKMFYKASEFVLRSGAEEVRIPIKGAYSVFPYLNRCATKIRNDFCLASGSSCK